MSDGTWTWKKLICEEEGSRPLSVLWVMEGGDL